jgi:hypothetical protein
MREFPSTLARLSITTEIEVSCLPSPFLFSPYAFVPLTLFLFLPSVAVLPLAPADGLSTPKTPYTETRVGTTNLTLCSVEVSLQLDLI